jgi:hypothetical protein
VLRYGTDFGTARRKRSTILLSNEASTLGPRGFRCEEGVANPIRSPSAFASAPRWSIPRDRKVGSPAAVTGSAVKVSTPCTASHLFAISGTTHQALESLECGFAGPKRHKESAASSAYASRMSRLELLDSARHKLRLARYHADALLRILAQNPHDGPDEPLRFRSRRISKVLPTPAPRQPRRRSARSIRRTFRIAHRWLR